MPLGALRTSRRVAMFARLFPRFAVMLSLVLLAVSAPAVPALQAAPQSTRPSQVVTVSGTIVYNGTTPLPYTFVLATPVISGTPDPNQSQYTFTDNTGVFTFNSLAAGDYSLDVEPYCVSNALPLRGYSFNVPVTTAPVDLGTIALPIPTKHIQGHVTLAGSSTPITTTAVDAYNYETSQYVCARSDSAGSYTLGVGGGNWEVSVPSISGAHWMFTQAPPVVTFAEDTSAETATIDLEVTPTNATLTGRVLGPNGQPLPLPTGVPTSSVSYNYWASIDIWNTENNSFAYVYLNIDGSFELPVVAGRYNLNVWLSQTDYPGLIDPPSQFIEVGATTINLGDIQLDVPNKRIVGVVSDDQAPPQPVANAYVQAYDAGGRFAARQTGTDGSYELQVPAGIWTVNVYPPDTSYLGFGASDVISTTADTTQTLNFTLPRAVNEISGTLKDQKTGQPVTSVDAWAYARIDEPETWTVVASAPVVNGQFHLDVGEGHFLVGVYLDPNSDYSLAGEVAPAALASRLAAHQDLSTAAMAQLEQSAYEQHVTFAPDTDPSATLHVEVPLAHNDATVAGKLIDSQTGKAAIGATGEVVAWPAAANASAQWTQIVSETGSFALKLTQGDWYLGYYLYGEDYNDASAPTLVHAVSNTTVVQDLNISRLDGVIEGVVQDDNGNALAGTYIWIQGPNFEQYALTDEHGAFSVPVPLHDGNQTARYTVGTLFNCEENGACLLDADPMTIQATPRSLLGQLRIAPQAITLRAKKKGPVITIKGKVNDSGGNPRNGALVNFSPSPGSFANDDTNSNGEYSLSVTFPSGTRSAYYRLEAGYWGGYAFYPFETRTGTINVPSTTSAGAQPSQVAVSLPDARLDEAVALPKAGTYTFKVSDGWTYTFTDATQLQIPANAVPLTPTAQVRVTVEATPLLPQTSLYSQATYYGYTITLYDAANGKRISEPLLEDAQLTLRYADSVLAERHIAEGQVRPANFAANIWQVPAKYALNTTSNKVTIQTRSLGSWALVRPQLEPTVLRMPVVRR
jgi:protocatechuate 3,4-dioxygenase beta subunit